MIEVSTLFVSITPAIITGLALFYMQRKQNHRDRRVDSLSSAKQQESLLSMKMLMATLKLAEATAISMRDGKCNGEIKAAVIECESAKNAYYNFLNSKAYETLTGG